ncbi:DUF72 domain-containing protein [Phenylobacterium sp.]|jgi:uncharacterized protein YecE (DUF72 family)|uniref:DUF72 domain-containing protein n=1 Tax=Phenylobacterium sp. TaxID=1871053 RepID=UPI002E320E49|nr:DUF72 domain-containing protein [Phenylobacterium sp.]HEX2561049.1 DUF72 domain-containing protein [Phenylobacterium sp.]
MTRIRIATAGWSIPRSVAEAFPTEGAGLQRYAARFDAVEINSTFYRGHRESTYARWIAATPADFRFALKLPRAITHEARLVNAAPALGAFRTEALQLQDKLGPLLVQLPPSLVFSLEVAEQFFADLRELWPEAVACEPRHPSWFGDEAEALLRSFRIARVAADPARHPAAGQPGGWNGLAYWRLHGSPRMYYSSYADAVIAELAAQLRTVEAQETWCVFDNTTSGAAAANALALQGLISR